MNTPLFSKSLKLWSGNSDNLSVNRCANHIPTMVLIAGTVMFVEELEFLNDKTCSLF